MFLGAFALTSQAQIETPAPSPFSRLEQVVGLTDVAIEYSRPATRGREIYGNLVPYDELWRTGANKNTIISFSTDVTIAGQTLKAGDYAIFTKPGKESWIVYFYSDSDNWGTPQTWDQAKIAALATVSVVKMPAEMAVESFTITIDDIKSGGANLSILWSNVYVAVPFQVPSDAAVVASIDETLSGPSANDYYTAAVYYLDTNKDIAVAKEYMDKAMTMIEEPRFWQLRQQSLILAKAGDTAGAIKAAKASLQGASVAGNKDYIKLNKDSLKEWGAL